MKKAVLTSPNVFIAWRLINHNSNHTFATLD
jgi:hypothetical protein